MKIRGARTGEPDGRPEHGPTPHPSRKEIFMSNKSMVLAIFKDEGSADAAAAALTRRPPP